MDILIFWALMDSNVCKYALNPCTFLANTFYYVTTVNVNLDTPIRHFLPLTVGFFAVAGSPNMGMVEVSAFSLDAGTSSLEPDI